MQSTTMMRVAGVGVMSAVLMALAGATAGTIAQAESHRPTGGVPVASHAHPAPSFKRNARGQSYGSAADATSDAQVPDLVQAYATNGRLGYIDKDDLIADAPNNPDEAIRASAQSRASVIPVYATDGVTRIGEFVLQAASSP